MTYVNTSIPQAAAITPPRETLDSIQALRGIAAALVVFFHLAVLEDSYGHFSSHPLAAFRYFGQKGVDLFFVISGFIIVWTNFEKFGQREAIPKYFARRIVRIFPLYWLAFAFAYVTSRIGLNHALEQANTPSNLVGIFFLLPIECVHIVPTSWTLTYELWFYLIFALALCFGRRWFPALLLGWLGTVVVATVFPPGAPASAIRRVANIVVHLRTTQFMLGAAIALLLKRRPLSRPLLWFGTGVVVFAIAAVRTWVLASRTHTDDLATPDLIALFGLASGAIVAGAVTYEQRRGGRFVPRWLVALGSASYSIYLWHLFVFAILRRGLEPLNRNAVGPYLLWLTALAASGIAAGFLSYRLLEEPMLRRLTATINRQKSSLR